MTNPISKLSKLDSLKPSDLNCNIFTVYNYDGESIQELLCQFFTKINECVDISNATFKLATWLVNEGLEIEVVKKLELWLADGTLADIINRTIFDELNKKVDRNLELIRNIYYNVKDFGAKGDGLKDDIIEIQYAIDKVNELGGGRVLLPPGTYKTTKPIYLPSRVELVGSGGNQTTYIKKVKGGLTSLDSNVDYSRLNREGMLGYDACIVFEADGAYQKIKGIHLESFDINNRCQWGILAPYTQLNIFEDVNVMYFNECWRIFNAWNMNFKAIRNIHSVYGFRLEGNKNDFVGACTSWNFDRVFTEYVDHAYKFKGLQYSSLNSVCCDQVSKRGYEFQYCVGVSINGMGMENSAAQILFSYFSQLSVNGFYFLGIKPMVNWEGSKNALIEVENNGRLGCGLVMKSGEFKSDTSGKKKFYGSYHSTISLENIRNWDGEPIDDLEPTSQCKFTFDNFDDFNTNKPLKANNIRLDVIKSSYAQGQYNIHPGIVTYIDVGNANGVTSLRLSREQIAKAFDWVTSTDNYMWIPLKISVTENYNGSCNHIWNAQNTVTSTHKETYGTDIVSEIKTDSRDLIIDFSSSVSRPKVVITLA